MVDERTQALREMAAHQGLRLKTARRRKPGGDFERFGLEDGDGKPVLGIGGSGGLEATAEEIEAYLREQTRSRWATSAKGLKRRKTPPPPKPEARPKPRFVPQVANLFDDVPAAKREEAFTEILSAQGVRIERIVSGGQATPEDAPMQQDHDEWVIVLAGEAAMRIADSTEVVLRPGDHLTIARRQKHWVTRTSADPVTVWLAVHLG